MLQDNLNHPINAFEMENYSNQEFVNNNKSNDLQKPYLCSVFEVL